MMSHKHKDDNEINVKCLNSSLECLVFNKSTSNNTVYCSLLVQMYLSIAVYNLGESVCHAILQDPPPFPFCEHVLVLWLSGSSGFP